MTAIDRLLAELMDRHRPEGRQRAIVIQRVGADSVRVSVTDDVHYADIIVGQRTLEADGASAEDAAERLITATDDNERNDHGL